MKSTFESYIHDNQICTANDRILVAVSGGTDSMALLHLFVECGYKVGVAHCNFQMRGDESVDDQEFVRQMAKKYGCKFYTTLFDTVKYAKGAKMGIQEAARSLRYTWFSKIMLSEGYNLLATAHHQDDQIETVFLNIMRGAGFFGLQGMKPKKDHIIRPLLFATKKSIIEFAAAHQIQSREDSSNKKSIYRRNFIRHKIIPKIEQRVPSFKNRMSENIAIWQKSARLLEGILMNEISSHCKAENDLIVLETEAIESSLRDLVVFEWLRPYGYNYTQVMQMISAIDKGHSGRHFYSKMNRVTVDRKKIILGEKPNVAHSEILIENTDRSVHLPGGIITFKLANGVKDILEENKNIAYLDMQKIRYPLTLRKWNHGDSFQPLGMEGRSQKLKKYFSNQKLNVFEKERQWLLTSENNITWIVGRRLDERFKITPTTKYILRCTWTPY